MHSPIIQAVLHSTCGYTPQTTVENPRVVLRDLYKARRMRIAKSRARYFIQYA
jgi:hypothetical protein